MARRQRTDWDAIGREAILDLLADRLIVPWAEAIARISDRGWKEYPKVQPLQLQAARQQLRADGLIVEDTTAHHPPVTTLSLPIPPGRKREYLRLRGSRRKAYRKYLSWAGDLYLCGRHAENVLLDSLKDAASDAGLWVPAQRPGLLADVNGVAIGPGPLDALAHVLELPDIRSEVALVFEVKNIHKWIYERAPELWELLVKAADLATKDVLVMPVLVCSRSSWTTGQLAKDIGFLTCQLREQIFSPSIPEDEFQAFVDEFGLVIAQHAGPSDPITTFLKRTVRLSPPPSLPEDEDIPWYHRQASRFAQVAPVILAHDALAASLPGDARRRVFGSFKARVAEAVDWPLVKGW